MTGGRRNICTCKVKPKKLTHRRSHKCLLRNPPRYSPAGRALGERPLLLQLSVAQQRRISVLGTPFRSSRMSGATHRRKGGKCLRWDSHSQNQSHSWSPSNHRGRRSCNHQPAKSVSRSISACQRTPLPPLVLSDTRIIFTCQPGQKQVITEF